MQQSSIDEGASYLRAGTIVASITGPGGAIAGLRLSGPETAEIFGRLCHQSGQLLQAPRRMIRVRLLDMGGVALDEALAVYFEEGASFTG